MRRPGDVGPRQRGAVPKKTSRVLLVTTTTGYQTRAFAAAAERLGIDLPIASDRCHVLDDPWRDGAVPIRFHEEAQAVRAIREAAAARPLDGVVAAGDRPAVVASLAAEALRVPGNPPPAARAAGNKLRTRERLRAAGLPCPRFCVIPGEAGSARLASAPEDVAGGAAVVSGARLADAAPAGPTRRPTDAARFADPARFAGEARPTDAAWFADAARFTDATRLTDATRPSAATRPTDAARLTDAARPTAAARVADAARFADAARRAGGVGLPCVVKPLAMSASRGVMRADTPDDVERAAARLRRLLGQPEVRALRDPANDAILVEDYVEGREVAVEGLVTAGRFRALAIFDKPDPLDGPCFEETIYVTPAGLSPRDERRVVDQVAAAVAALGLAHGPVHAECRLNARGVFVIDIAARPIGGLCARTLRFVCGTDSDAARAVTGRPRGDPGRSRGPGPGSDAGAVTRSLEELLLQHALGRDVAAWRRSPGASGVMMIPIPREGRYRAVEGVEDARRVPGIEDVVVTAAAGQRIAPPPEGASYLGFLFARAPRADDAVTALRRAHRRLRFDIRPSLPVGGVADATGEAPADGDESVDPEASADG